MVWRWFEQQKTWLQGLLNSVLLRTTFHEQYSYLRRNRELVSEDVREFFSISLAKIFACVGTPDAIGELDEDLPKLVEFLRKANF
jgi:hypothetical protein